ncbi:MAG: hypothetical protein U0791_21320 [Gemmataceae bacterium]
MDRTLGILVASLYFCAGVGGTVGWIAALRGNRKWSRAIYLQAVAVPIGTLFAFLGHGIRWGCLNPALNASPPLDYPPGRFESGFWRPRVHATLWVLALATVAAAFPAIQGNWSEFGTVLMVVPSAAAFFLVSGAAPFSGYSCSVTEAGLSVGGREIRWSDVTGTLYVPIPGYRMIWIRTGGMVPSTVVPLFLKDFAGFARAVRKCSPDDHPLRSRLDRLKPVV